MRFALFTTNLAGGGAEKALAKIGIGLASRGHEVDFIVCEDVGEYQPPNACRFHVLSRRAGHGWFGKRCLAWRLNRLLADGRHDLLVSTLPFADEIAVLARAPRHVCRVANTLSAEIARLPGVKGKRRLARYRALYARRPLVAVSQGVADDLRQNFGIAAERLRVIVNPFDFAHMQVMQAQPCATLPKEPYILHVGRFVAQKRHDLLLAAFAVLVRAGLPHRLILLTPPDPRLVKMVAQQGLEDRTVIAGFQPNPYVWMAHAELLVLCSDHEGLPNVLIEALACGTRVVSTDCPSGPREILRGKLASGLVPCGDAAALARVMHDTLAQPKPAATEVETALAPFDSARVLDAWEALARELR